MKRIDRRTPFAIGPLTAVFFAGLLLCLTAAGAAAQQAQPGEVSPLNEKWLGDFDEIAKKRQIRVLVAYSKTFYFIDRGRQRGISHDLLKEFEKFVNKKLHSCPKTGLE